ncbi:C4-dicarboxylate-specific signal transduction histidine kinase [Microbacterium sp. BE35]|uniref:sensor histidine kinase n=1 Tax=Microbacterium sp. BE35 TaxID=2817773 RepID=UPI00285DC98E|nr:ATP-binding protein [Microbacterium sp. BE35]MDR7188169.1 C4-dicarboxylate-specific signal transduction histidine kinase [Microbacterium sp. BE35]
MGELTGVLIHEISQPLAAIDNYISGCIARLASGSFSPEELIEALRLAHRETSRAGSITSSIRSFLQGQATRREVVDVNDVVRSVVPLIELKANLAACHVRVELCSDDMLTRADAVLLRQVLLNLVFNAAESIDSSASDTPRERLIVVSTDRDAGWVHLNVADDGPGLPDVGHDLLFESFFTTKAEGLGLGLSLCRTVVESFGGSISASTGHGVTRFEASMPAVNLSPTPASPGSAS